MPPTEQTISAPHKPIGILGLSGIVGGIILACLKALRWSHGVVTAEVVGYAVGGILLPFLIAYAIAGRIKIRDWNKVGIWFLVLSFVFYLISHGT